MLVQHTQKYEEIISDLTFNSSLLIYSSYLNSNISKMQLHLGQYFRVYFDYPFGVHHSSLLILFQSTLTKLDKHFF